MTKIRVYACPGTETHPPHQFRYLHHPSVEADPLPRYCSVCSFDSQGEDMPAALTTPHLAKSIKGVVDTMHREMEAGAEFRAQMAQEQFGLDASEAALMKETNMKDNLRAGDTSFIEVNNPVSQVMAAAPGVTGFQGANGLGYSGAVSQGAFPNAGAHAAKSLRELHARNTQGAGHSGPVMSTLPALETTLPTYRPRV